MYNVNKTCSTAIDFVGRIRPWMLRPINILALQMKTLQENLEKILFILIDMLKWCWKQVLETTTLRKPALKPQHRFQRRTGETTHTQAMTSWVKTSFTDPPGYDADMTLSPYPQPQERNVRRRADHDLDCLFYHDMYTLKNNPAIVNQNFIW